MTLTPYSARPPSSCAWVSACGFVLEYSKSKARHISRLFKFLDDKRYGFCKVLSEGHFRSFYAILEKVNFYKMKINTQNNLKSYIFVCDNTETFVTLVRHFDILTVTKLLKLMKNKSKNRLA